MIRLGLSTPLARASCQMVRGSYFFSQAFLLASLARSSPAPATFTRFLGSWLRTIGSLRSLGKAPIPMGAVVVITLLAREWMVEVALTTRACEGGKKPS